MTLLEVLLVIALLGMVLAFAFPDLQSQMDGRSLMESAHRLRSLITMARAQSMRDGVKYRIQFPGTPDPLDEYAEKEVGVPIETQQPEVIRQCNPIDDPEAFCGFDDGWNHRAALMAGTRCVMAYHGTPSFDVEHGGDIAGRPFGEDDDVEFVSLSLRPDGTSDWITFVLTDLPPDVELMPWHCHRIINVCVDGRTGYVWFQRALTVDELEIIQDKEGSPVFHRDFLRRELIDEVSVVDVFQEGGDVRGRFR